MNDMLILMTPQGGGDQSMLPTLVMFGAIFAIMYFMMIRPQQKRQKEHQKMLESLKKGDKVVTSTGIHGTITDIEETTYIVQIAENTKVKFEKTSVSAKKD